MAEAATAILAKGIPMVIAGSFSNIFSRNSVNNALMALEVPKLVERLREAFKNEKEKVLTRRTGWKVLWDVKRSKVVVTEKDGASWSVKVGELPPNVQGREKFPWAARVVASVLTQIRNHR
ncbi:hypothetical protein KNSL1_001719 [Colletotrichum chrysophilum]|nr:hypothetical protein KNSL1_001719 [Colletotrichum chrysophilum]